MSPVLSPSPRQDAARAQYPDGVPDAPSPQGASAGSDWLAPLLARAPHVMYVASAGSMVELLLWGERGRPGVFLLHGAGAHAHWWDGVAPLLAETHRVAAMTLPGHGGSGWRDRYSSADIVEDARACIAAASLGEAGPPVFVGHSIGGAHLMHGAVYAPDAMRGLVLLDTSFRTPGGGKPVVGRSARRIFATEAEAIARFRLAPPGPAHEQRLVEHVARHALVRIAGHGDEAGWCWRADPAYWFKLVPGIEQGPYPVPLCPRVPTVQIIAARSHVAAVAATLPLDDRVRRIFLPECGHHIMLDRPLALAAALSTLLAVWP